MIIKKTYDENDYIILEVLEEIPINGLVILRGIVLEYVSTEYQEVYLVGEEAEIIYSDLVEVLEP